MGQFLDLHIRTCGEDMPFRHGEPGYCLTGRTRVHCCTMITPHVTIHLYTHTHSHKHMQTQAL